jgi:hypothetical protein
MTMMDKVESKDERVWMIVRATNIGTAQSYTTWANTIDSRRDGLLAIKTPSLQFTKDLQAEPDGFIWTELEENVPSACLQERLTYWRGTAKRAYPEEHTDFVQREYKEDYRESSTL